MTEVAQIPQSPARTMDLAQFAQRGQRLGKRILLEARTRPVAALAAAFLVAVVVASILAGVISPYNPQYENLAAILHGPSSAHLLGTDELGRDVLTRLLYGGRVSLLAAGESVLTFVVVGLPIGLISGYAGGRVDRGIMWLADIVLSLPHIIVLLVVAAVLQGDAPLMISLGVIASPVLVRTTRAATLAVREELYVKAAEVLGLPRWRVLANHIVPRVLPTVLVQLSVFASAAVVIETALGFLGLDSTPPAPSWGSMVAEAATSIDQSQWMMITTGLTIALTSLSLGLVGDAIREISTGQSLAKRRVGAQAAKPANLTAAASARATLPGTSATATVDEVQPPVPEVHGGQAPQSQPGTQMQASTEPRPGAGQSQPQRSDVLLSVTDLAITVRTAQNDLPIVDRVTFDLKRGECLGIVGESGCGKSMMSLAVLGLLPESCQVSGGRVLFDGQDITHLASNARRQLRGRGIAYVSQEPMQALDPGATVGAILREAIRRNQDMTRPAAREEAVNLLGQVRIPNPRAVALQYAHELSGGMAQRVCIALALAGKPQLIIADEPTTALDVTVQADILDLLHALRKGKGVAVLLISHDWGVVADSCDRAAVMYAGELVEWGGLSDIFARPLHPYTEALLLANPHLLSTGPLMTIPGTVPPPGQWPAGCRFAARCRYATDDCLGSAVEPRHLGDGRLARCLYPGRVGTSQEVVDV